MKPQILAIFLTLCLVAFVKCESVEEKTSTVTPKPTPPITTTRPTTVMPTTTTTMPTPPKADDAPVVNYTIMGKSEEKKDIYCLMAEFSAKIDLTYNNTEGHVETGHLSLFKNSTVDQRSTCKNDLNQTVLIININGNPKNTLKMIVVENNTKYYVSDVYLELNEASIHDRIPLAPTEDTIKAQLENVKMFEAPVSKSYVCKSDDSMIMASDKHFTIKLDVHNVKFDAFRTKEGDSYRDGQLCQKDEEFSDIIPIAVGAALAALVVIVLIAYFIGRRRSRRLAYQSV